ncbi:MAG TPA: hypothetical protein VGP70_24790 [Actinomadura sp.]|nr:hypothetical protein [Actinomadura sp.]
MEIDLGSPRTGGQPVSDRRRESLARPARDAVTGRGGFSRPAGRPPAPLEGTMPALEETPPFLEETPPFLAGAPPRPRRGGGGQRHRPCLG